jgi:hypothetical protein
MAEVVRVIRIWVLIFIVSVEEVFFGIVLGGGFGFLVVDGWVCGGDVGAILVAEVECVGRGKGF